MNKEQIWNGGNGKQYLFTIYAINTKFKLKQNGNYIFTKLINNAWEAVYIGQGDIKQRTERHLDNGCVLRKGATHIHAHLNNRESNRLAEEEDLLSGNTEAYEPTGCNKKTGG